MKKILSLFLAVLMIIGMMPAVFAESDLDYEGINETPISIHKNIIADELLVLQDQNPVENETVLWKHEWR